MTPGFRATFMPKLFVNKTGNGAQSHVSVWNPDGLSNLFHDDHEELVPTSPTHIVHFSELDTTEEFFPPFLASHGFQFRVHFVIFLDGFSNVSLLFLAGAIRVGL